MFSNAQRLSSYSFIFLPVFPLFSPFPAAVPYTRQNCRLVKLRGANGFSGGHSPNLYRMRSFPVADYLEMAYLACMAYMFSGTRAAVVWPDGYYPQRTAYLLGETHCFVYLYI